ncbi:cytochrome b5-like heme steroid binding domain containing protein [Stylonychia lemnae]|uniref:Cytochrome b5-like heme steroid binding domain containing protein n=1 Tax=Stylonychia lemnae TaxID=5949 RepID=A0A078A569_STYLE|nr:cytochrome b5-like heme steroid binding domain containing protein [Stylonychia lemnae]|eukprot:CDW77349.1 cytochrome b5-like heme steroid binding domain containing protein [Stylonychia lemnae]
MINITKEPVYRTYVLVHILLLLKLGRSVIFRDSSTLDAYVLNNTHIAFEVSVPNNHLLAIGFGNYMTDSDMVMWQSKGVQSACQDMWSTGRRKPSIDIINDYNTQIKYDQAQRAFFRSIRRLDTGDKYDYEIDHEFKEINMIWAFIDTSADLQRHYMDNKGRMKMRMNQQGQIEFELIPILDIALIAGWLQFMAWTVLGLVQVASYRYLRRYWWLNNWLHAVCGTIICLETLIIGFVGMIDGFFITWHVILGFAIMGYVFLVSIFGFYVLWYQNTVQWQSAKVARLKKIKRISGYILIVLSQLAMISGVFEYNHQSPSALRSLLGILDIIVFFGIWGAMEFYFRRHREDYVPFIDKKIEMSSEEFYDRIKRGEKLVLLNDMVLNVSKYQFNHPGGKFVIAQNVGRDITKFFYGAYQMENYGNQKPYFHSNVARAIVNELMMGRMSTKAPKFIAQAVGKYPVNSNTKCFVFRSHTNVPGISKYYPDISYIGKHYLLSSLDQFQVRRQYTISNCMQGETYNWYLKAISYCLSDSSNVSMSFRNLVTNGLPVVNEIEVGEDGQNNSAYSIMNFETQQDMIESCQKNGCEVVMTIKDYKAPDGLATRIFEDTSNGKNIVLTVQGPMGIGLDIQRTGTHIAFTGGTGCLVFVDLVAFLLRKSMKSLKPSEDNQIDGDSFKFVLYVSFPKREEVIGLELYEGLVQIQEKFELKNFEFHMRLSNETKERWDFKFLDQQLDKYNENLQKIWVCGPPRMNEDFDKNLLRLQNKYGYGHHTYDIL